VNRLQNLNAGRLNLTLADLGISLNTTEGFSQGAYSLAFAD
jgi:hypothetical protein